MNITNHTKALFFHFLAALFFCAAVSPVGAQTWVTNRSGDYQAATNWQGGVAPGISSNVTFQNPDMTTTSTVTFSDAATNAQVLFQRGVFDIQTGANAWTITNITGLRVGSSSGTPSDVTFNGGTVNVTAAQVMIGVVSTDNNNVLRLTNGSVFNSQSASAILVGRGGSGNQFVVSGGSAVSAAGLVVGSLAGANDNRATVEGAGSELRLRGTLTLNQASTTTNNALVISNGGSVYVTNATASSARILVGNSASQTNDGASILITGSGSQLVSTTDNINFGTSPVGGTGNRITVADGGLLEATNASLNLAMSVDSAVRFVMDGGTANLRRTTLQRATMDMLSGSLNFSQDFTTAATWTLDFAGGTISAGSANFLTGALTVGDGNAAVAAGYVLTGNGTHGIGDLLTVQTDGSVSGNGVIAADAAGTTATAVRNSGVISAGSGQTLRVVGSLTNQSGATLSVANGGTFIASAASTNAGTVNIGSGSAATFSNGLSSAGSLIVNGTLTGATTVSGGGVLSGAGTMASAVTIGDGGTLAVGNSPGTMTFDQDLTLDLNSTSLFEINGFGAGEYDLALGGAGSQTVTFGGALQLAFSEGFNTLGSVTIFDFDNYSGSFASFNSTGLAEGYTASFNEANGLVTVVPEPSTYALLALSAAGLAAHVVRRRRRG